ncbi:hypothetical protein EYF80_053624 [Liparis tanakae]|uniref:Uncharacterized protein n=1 Tax=Liparis tanakae TaxID=230148 RepID=A0A4Z2F527_9TELE|nr:hypothetical protein EYF80_053624 [Liparis tanakae]
MAGGVASRAVVSPAVTGPQTRRRRRGSPRLGARRERGREEGTRGGNERRGREEGARGGLPKLITVSASSRKRLSMGDTWVGRTGL